MSEAVRIMGIDPGLARTGYGVIDLRQGKLLPVAYGCVETSASASMARRLQDVFERVEGLVGSHLPDEVAVEQLFFSSNARTAFAVGQARGVILLALAKSGVPLSEYTPLELKQAVVGYGNAAKGQIQYMVKAILNLTETPRPDDAADALALAICHAHLRSRRSLMKEAR